MSDRVTLELLGNIRQQLGDVQGTQRQILEAFSRHDAEDTLRFAAQALARSTDSARIGSLERSRAWLKGVVVAAHVAIVGLGYIVLGK